MQAAPIKELKSALADQNPLQLKAIILRLARFKKENKELLTYLLFASQDEEGYIKQIQEEVSEQFEQITSSSWYIIKKQVRKTLRQDQNSNPLFRKKGNGGGAFAAFYQGAQDSASFLPPDFGVAQFISAAGESD
jgi:peptide subunit release factor 1 (eRF1)